MHTSHDFRLSIDTNSLQNQPLSFIEDALAGTRTVILRQDVFLDCPCVDQLHPISTPVVCTEDYADYKKIHRTTARKRHIQQKNLSLIQLNCQPSGIHATFLQPDGSMFAAEVPQSRLNQYMKHETSTVYLLDLDAIDNIYLSFWAAEHDTRMENDAAEHFRRPVTGFSDAPILSL